MPTAGREARQRHQNQTDAGRRCSRHLAGLVRAGAGLYERRRHLPWLAKATPAEIESDDPATGHAIIARLERSLRAERRRGRAGHWTYDINRHIALSQALAAERARIAGSVAKDNAPADRTDRGV